MEGTVGDSVVCSVQRPNKRLTLFLIRYCIHYVQEFQPTSID